MRCAILGAVGRRTYAAGKRPHDRAPLQHADVIVAETRDRIGVRIIQQRSDVTEMNPIAQAVRPIDEDSSLM